MAVYVNICQDTYGNLWITLSPLVESDQEETSGETHSRQAYL